MEVDVNKTFQDKFPEATVKFLVGSEEVKNELKEVLGRLQTSEEERVLAEENRIRNEENRDAFETYRRSEEEGREAAEKRREAAEDSRVAAENSREAAEQERKQNEVARIVAEQERKTNESGRASADYQRDLNESRREAAEDSRVAAEQSRVSSEANREYDESVRRGNETLRKEAEQKRDSAEAIRAEAEQQRISAEQERIDNDIERGEELQQHAQELSEHTQSIKTLKSDIEDLGDAPRSEVDNPYYKTIHLMDRASGKDVYPITIPEAVIDKNGNNILDIIKRYWAEGNTEADVMYGVEWNVTVADPAMTRIGNMALHRQLPIQNRMKGCLLDDDGNVVEYLPVTSWEGATLDGSRGQVMVELPEHYRKFETDGNIRRAKISEYPLPGYHVVPKMYISAYEATLQRSTNKLCSVKNLDPDYRGGFNQVEWDGTYRSLLGKPLSGISRGRARTAARNRNTALAGWSILDYTVYKSMVWLYFIEYANRNCRLPILPKSDGGYAQGGLGDSVLQASFDWGSYNSYGPFKPIGCSDELGNRTGEVAIDVELPDGSISVEYANRYRGVELPYGHLGKWLDGVNIQIEPGSDGTSRVYISSDPSIYSDSSYDGYSIAGILPRAGGYITDILFGVGGEVAASQVGGSSTTYWPYYYMTAIASTEVLKGFVVCGTLDPRGGLLTMDNDFNLSGSYASTGTRLCFIPQNNE